MGNQRTIITISDQDKLWLGNYSKARGISMAESVRRGIARLKEKETLQTYKRLVNQTQGIWKKEDGLKYQEKMRSEWR